MKMRRLAVLMAFAISVSFVSMVFAQDQSVGPRLQKVSEFGEEMCAHVTTNPAELIKLLPIRYAIRVALSTSVGGEDELYALVESSGQTMDELIDMTLDESGMLDEGAGEKFFGTMPEAECNWYEAEETPCATIYKKFSEVGLLNGSIQATYDALATAAEEQELTSCARIRIVTPSEDMKLGLLMFDKAWYMAGELDAPKAAEENTTEPVEPSE